jgi:hypothetical protein
MQAIPGLNKLQAIVPLMIWISSSLMADFSSAHLELHPRFPGNSPFILEISGTWPTDCHPGEQKPVVNSFDGHTVEIEYKIVVVHITCNITDTDYRSLVDMSEVLRRTKPLGDVLEVRVDFLGENFEHSLDLVCQSGDSCPVSQDNQQLPERGLYITPGRPSEGLLVARQNNVTAIYPLVYDDSGRGEWLFSVGRVVEDSFFADMFRWAGGDCFNCESSGSAPEMTNTGHLSVLIDRPGAMQVKVNDRPFLEYQKLVYGYNIIPLGQAGEQPLTGLEGRWALSENHGTDPPLGDLTNFLPPAFDVKLEGLSPVDGGAADIGQISYLVTTVTGEELGQLICKGQISEIDGVNVCEFIDPTDQAEPLLLFYQDGPDSLSIKYGRAVIAIGVPPGGRAVRLD